MKKNIYLLAILMSLAVPLSNAYPFERATNAVAIQNNSNQPIKVFQFAHDAGANNTEGTYYALHHGNNMVDVYEPGTCWPKSMGSYTAGRVCHYFEGRGTNPQLCVIPQGSKCLYYVSINDIPNGSIINWSGMDVSQGQNSNTGLIAQCQSLGSWFYDNSTGGSNTNMGIGENVTKHDFEYYQTGSILSYGYPYCSNSNYQFNAENSQCFTWNIWDGKSSVGGGNLEKYMPGSMSGSNFSSSGCLNCSCSGGSSCPKTAPTSSSSTSSSSASSSSASSSSASS